MAALPAAKPRTRSSRGGSRGYVARPLPDREAGEQQQADRGGAEHLAAGPAGGLAPHQGPDQAEHAAGEQRHAGHVEPAVRAPAPPG